LLAGIVAAGWIGAKRLARRGYDANLMYDVVLWAVPLGIVGARIYHVLSSPQAYFGPGGNPWDAFRVWEGGLGVWGAIAVGAVGGVIAAKRCGLPVGVLADALAPGIAVGQAVGRLGNWFNQELFGSPTTLPWGLQVSDAKAVGAGFPAGTLFHPTFAYEALWCLGIAALLVWADQRFDLRHGQVFFAYMVAYCAGRIWIEALRVDPASRVLGLRLNVWTSLLIGLVGVGLFIWSRRKWPSGGEADQADAEAEAEDGAEAEANDSDDPVQEVATDGHASPAQEAGAKAVTLEELADDGAIARPAAEGGAETESDP